MATYSIWCGPGSAVANQTATFGAQTIATAGGFRPVSSTGQTVALSSYNSLVSGSLGIYTPVISGGTLIFTGGAGAPNGAVLRCGLALGGTVDITIATQANTYSVATVAEINAALSAIGSAGGKTVLIRRGAYSTAPVGSVVFGNGVTYSSAVTMQGEGTLAQREAGYGAKFTPYISINGTSNIVWSGVEVETPGYPGAFELTGTCASVTIQDNYIHGKYYAPMTVHDNTWSNANGITLAGTLSSLTIQRNLIEHVSYGIQGDCAGAFTIDLNEIRFYMNDAIYLGWATPSTAARAIHRNVIRSSLATVLETHSDAIAFSAVGNASLEPSTNVTIRQNVIFNTPTVSAGTTQGITAFTEDTFANGKQFQGIVVAGNIVAIVNLQAISFANLNGGFIGYNYVVTTSTNAVDDLGNPVVSAPTLSTGYKVKAGTITVKKNVADGLNISGTTASGNLELGVMGSLVPYSSAFDWANPAIAAVSYAQLMTNLGAKATAGAGPFSSGYATYGNPRDPTGWSYNAGLEA